MAKISRIQLRNIILEEMKKMEEDAIVVRDNPGVLSRHDDPGRQIMYKSCSECGYKMSMYEGDKGVCEQCGSSMMKEGKKGSCSECGTISMVYEGDKGVCEQCGYSTMESEMKKEYMHEGSCGSHMTIDHDSDDDFIPDHMTQQGSHDFDALQAAMFDRFPHMKSIDVEFDHDDDVKIGNHKHYKGSYMAKSHLYKVNKYAEKLYHMIPDGHNLEIADDIGEVYHALDHHKFKGDV